MVSVGRPLSGSMTVTALSLAQQTKRRPSLARARSLGLSPTAMVRRTAPVSVSITETLSLPQFETYSVAPSGVRASS